MGISIPVLGVPRSSGGAAAMTFLFQADFSGMANNAGPLSSPLAGDVGELALEQDANDYWSIASGQLVGVVGGSNTQVYAVMADGGSNIEFTRGGIGFYFDAFVTSPRTQAGFIDPSVIFASSIGNDSSVQSTPASAGILDDAQGTFVDDEDVAIVDRSTGAYYFVRNSGGTWRLGWVGIVGSLASYVMMLNPRNNGGAFNKVFAADMVANGHSVFDGDYELATNRTASPGVGATTTSEADALIEMTWTAATGETFELSTRRTDDDNRWILRASQAGSTVKLIQEQATVETERSSAAQTLTNSTDYRFVVIQDGADISTRVGSTAKNTYGSATFNQTATGVKVSHAGDNLIAWPRYPTAAAAALAALAGE